MLPQLGRRIVTYGLEPGADATARNIDLQAGGSSFDVHINGTRLGRFRVNVPGRHSVQNALAAIVAGCELDLTPEQIREGLECFKGVDRRFQIKAEVDGVTVVDDYGHHPTEIKAMLDAASLRGAKRIWAIFQPHRYSRTKFLMDDFAQCFEACDRVYVLDIYGASEEPIEGVASRRLVQRMAELGFGRARYAASEDAVVDEVLAEVKAGDLILTIGAGNVWRIAETLAARLGHRAARVSGVKA